MRQATSAGAGKGSAFHHRSIIVATLGLALVSTVAAGELESELGRAEIRVRSAPFPLVAGASVTDLALPGRLERLGYRRVRERPQRPGEYFFGNEVFWIFRREHRSGGFDHPASLLGLALERESGRITGARGIDGSTYPLEGEGVLWIEPETLSESLAADRAKRRPVRFDDLPEVAWKALLAAEDARFFRHAGVDGRSVARAALANVKKGRVAQGGSTITQQLVKNRELTPKRSMSRKVSEAIRALWLETRYDKREILEAYLNQVYYGHVDGLAIHGIGTAARVFFSKPPSGLSLAESALLAGIIHSPNALAPDRHEERARERRDWVLDRLEELRWIDESEIARARRAPLGLRMTAPENDAPVHLLSWVSDLAREHAADRLDNGRGVVVETTIDPYLQSLARRAVAEQLQALRASHRSLRDAPLSAALVALDARDGAVLAYVGGDPSDRGDRFDRARLASRQPGSAVKPLVMLEALGRCGKREPLNPATRVADEPLRIDLPTQDWEPQNYDRRYLGPIDLRTVLARSRNVPTVRVARWCGFEATARTFRRAGLEIPQDPPPSFVLGSVETSPLELARAYTIVATAGRKLEPRPVARIEKPGHSTIRTYRPKRRRVANAATAYLVRNLMRTAVEQGTAGAGRIEGFDVAAKTGTSSGLRDAWFAGHAGSVVAVVWVGLDDGRPLGLSGAAGAGPVWRAFMARAVKARPPGSQKRPVDIVERFVDSRTGLLVREKNPRAVSETFRRGALPRRDRFWRVDRAADVVY